ncbi:MAG: hypothetical protein A3H96_21675 [Acidobacteria bacterium RIFCSPLOWO2_02_FULL_67_36]|nr:MAG: hypothetical protein A3H96_21675 [Acidobacteria bacterium RIFCSPLOWO2_02_FULL_67_36]OFW20595.1 MAG: hypothetical protein A3G21_21970 [Acidobacteria bacterium RIFCSPLOWO2_12_FULL_66_21]
MAKRQIESLNQELATSLSVEELEERLETQVLRVPEAACDWSCDSVCSGGFNCLDVCSSQGGCHRVDCWEYCRDAQVE